MGKMTQTPAYTNGTAPGKFRLVDPSLVPVIAVRHGQHQDTDDRGIRIYTGLSEHPLSEEGEMQARRAAEFLTDYLFREFGPNVSPTLISSPQKRARQTADIIAREFGLMSEIDPRIGEFYTPPPVQGLPIADLESIDLNPMRHPEYFARSGETPDAIYQRVSDFLLNVYIRMSQPHSSNGNSNGAYHPSPVILVTHGGVLQALQYHYLESGSKGLGKPDVWLFDKHDQRIPYIARGDAVLARYDRDAGAFSLSRLNMQTNSRLL